MTETAPRKISTFSQLVYLVVAFLAFLFLLVLAYLIILLWLGNKKPPVGVLHLTPLEQGSSPD